MRGPATWLVALFLASLVVANDLDDSISVDSREDVASLRRAHSDVEVSGVRGEEFGDETVDGAGRLRTSPTFDADTRQEPLTVPNEMRSRLYRQVELPVCDMENELLVVKAITWNLGGAKKSPAPETLTALLKSSKTTTLKECRGSTCGVFGAEVARGDVPHVVAIGLQEFDGDDLALEHFILAMKSSLGVVYRETVWLNAVEKDSDRTFTPDLYKMGSQKLMVFTRCSNVEYEKKAEVRLKKYYVFTGKGAIAFSLHALVPVRNDDSGAVMGHRRKGVVIASCHLNSGAENRAQRESDARTVITELTKQLDIDPGHTSVVLMGDFNSRTRRRLDGEGEQTSEDETIEFVKERLVNGEIDQVVGLDELLNSVYLKELMFFEQRISFLPTYKRVSYADRQLAEYNADKRRGSGTNAEEAIGRLRKEASADNQRNANIGSKLESGDGLLDFMLSKPEKEKKGVSNLFKMAAGITQSLHVPSYTDRITVRPGNRIEGETGVWYGADYGVCEDPLCYISDHAPVFATIGFKSDEPVFNWESASASKINRSRRPLLHRQDSLGIRTAEDTEQGDSHNDEEHIALPSTFPPPIGLHAIDPLPGVITNASLKPSQDSKDSGVGVRTAEDTGLDGSRDDDGYEGDDILHLIEGARRAQERRGLGKVPNYSDEQSGVPVGDIPRGDIED